VIYPRRVTLEEIAHDIRTHTGCGSEICETCQNFVPGEGPPDARLVIVGEAPGAREEATGRPFVGPAGKMLDALLADAGLARDEVFITNVLKARPPGNRDPQAPEVAHHRPWLDAQLAIIDPELIVPLGRHALRHFDRSAQISQVHGSLIGERLFPLYHPAAGLHNPRLRATLSADAAALGAHLMTSRHRAGRLDRWPPPSDPAADSSPTRPVR
jgi:DNA polymerase